MSARQKVCFWCATESWQLAPACHDEKGWGSLAGGSLGLGEDSTCGGQGGGGLTSGGRGSGLWPAGDTRHLPPPPPPMPGLRLSAPRRLPCLSRTGRCGITCPGFSCHCTSLPGKGLIIARHTALPLPAQRSRDDWQHLISQLFCFLREQPCPAGRGRRHEWGIAEAQGLRRRPGVRLWAASRRPLPGRGRPRPVGSPLNTSPTPTAFVQIPRAALPSRRPNL